jgi:hypothetical protein
VDARLDSVYLNCFPTVRHPSLCPGGINCHSSELSRWQVPQLRRELGMRLKGIAQRFSAGSRP